LSTAAHWSLRGLPFGWVRNRLWRFSAGLILIPLSLWAVASTARPAIRPFSSLFATFLGGEEWFVAVAAAKQPGGDLYALADAHGRLAVVAEGERPRVVYAGNGESEGKSLSSLAWSPDGRRIGFCEDGIIKAYEIASGSVIPILQGELVLWSTDPDRMLVLKREGGGNTYHLYLADFTRRAATSMGVFDLSGLALGWDAGRGTLLVLGPDRLLIFILETKESTVIPLPPSLPVGLIVRGGRILPPDRAGRPYWLALFATPRGGKSFDVYLYDYDPARGEIVALPPLRGLDYEELVFDPGGRRVLGRLGMGIYRVLRAEEGSR
ncbi:MAG: hypothetical protein K6U03_12275, partial [Firmicutes bacterium]|nr:hypothetical protein [Bacillota bacterium]